MTVLNDVVTRVMVAGIPLAAALASRDFRRRIAGFAREQERLRVLYGITHDTPIRGYDDDTRAAVRAIVAADPAARVATTSGSTGTPKELAYGRERLRLYKRDSASCGVRAFARHGVRRPGIFIFAGLKSDDSFASLVLHDRGQAPPYFTGLVEPSRWLAHPRFAALVHEHGATAVRLFLMLLADPGMLYATNPSTLAAFFDDVSARWPESTALVRRFLDPADLARDAVVAEAARRIGGSAWPRRFQDVARAASALPVHEMLPGLRAWCSWDGGYVTGFLPALRLHLPPERFVHVPMYSMSTETIETLTWFDDDGATRFLPLGPHVLYEFLPHADSASDDDAPDDPAKLLAATSLDVGGAYSMVVSDPWGLRRYQTDDLFECVARPPRAHGLPDLRFLRRRGVAYSFTGEKLTGEQVTLAYAELRASFPSLARDVELVCLPAHAGAVPHYVLVIAPTSRNASGASALARADGELAAVAAALDASLARINHELRAKRESARVGPTKAVVVPYESLAVALDRRTANASDVEQRAWESQFKLAPLLKTRWEDLARRLQGTSVA